MGEDPDPLCGGAPIPDCTPTGPAVLSIRRNPARLTWKARTVTPGTGFGTPESSTRYVLCVWDTRSSVPHFKTDFAVPPGGLWSPLGTGALYVDRAGGSDGVTRVRLRSRPGVSEALDVRASGASAPMPLAQAATAFFAMEPAVTVQLVNSEGACWQSEFTSASASSGAKFQAKIR